MTKVMIGQSSYDYNTLKNHIVSMLDKLSGSAIGSGKKVIIKPNFLAPATPESAIITHPFVIKAIAEYVIEKGARPVISDSPAVGFFGRILQTGGFVEALKGLDVECREFKKSVSVDIGAPFGRIEIAEDSLAADVLINVPKLKTHCQMGLTLGVKNMFGCVVGLRKPEWHFRSGVDRALFARLIVQIYAAVKPAVTILDGILAMQGQGPGRSGKPRELNVLMSSDNAVALDMTVCRMLGLEPHELLTNRIAAEMGMDEKYEIEGKLPQIDDFRLPLMAPLVFGPPGLHKISRKHLVQRPVVTKVACRMCGECGKFCPAMAITNEPDHIKFDYDKCIRCYCCIEVCPHGALETKETFISRLARRIFRYKA
jgi:uncharacterized protein (DUF362 family)/Pyruvate/2-oxoacid:ferredoxin oxidoreductase delta subunit